jgi:antitoxin YefM
MPQNTDTIDIADLDETTRDRVLMCEVTGRRTVIAREGQPVAVVLSHDELTAMEETIEIAGRADLLLELGAALEEIRRGEALLAEELLEQ